MPERLALSSLILRLAGGTGSPAAEPDQVFRSFTEALERLAPAGEGPKIRLPGDRRYGRLR